MKHKIDCPVCKKGVIHFDFLLFASGTSFPCSEPVCNTSIKLPEDSQAPVKSAYEEIKKMSLQKTN